MSWAEGAARRSGLIAVLLLTLLYVGIRLLHLDQVVTTDEPFWLGRSANFYRALRSGEFEYTYQMAHPGVLTMWAGAIAFLVRAPDYHQLVTSNLTGVYSIERVLRSHGYDPLELMVAAKVSKVILQGAFFAVAIGFLQRLAGARIAAVTGLLIAFGPFLSGLDSALHVDGLFSIASFAALLAIIYASVRSPLDEAVNRRLGWWLPAGALSACALLTRATGAVLIGVAGLALLLALIEAIRRNRAGWARSTGRAAIGFFTWLIATVAVTFLLLPALWVGPLDVLDELWDWSSEAAEEGHENPIFFRGAVRHDDPGWLFYPVAIIWRTTPVEWLGVAALVALLPLLIRRRLLSRELVRLLIVAAVFALVYTIAMSTGAKKFDRYVLPLFPVIALFAAAGIVTALDWARRRWSRVSGRAAMAAGAVLIAVQALMMVTTMPYRLDFYNPLLGGPESAQHVLQMGWGQGGREAIALIEDEVEEGAAVNVQASTVGAAFSYFLPAGSPIQMRGFGLNTPAQWFETDYYIAGWQQVQRDLARGYRLLREYDPVGTVEIGGLTYFWIYQPKLTPLPEELRRPTACNAVFGETLQLMQITGRETVVDLYWLTLADPPATATVRVVFIAPDGSRVSSTTEWTPGATGLVSRARLTRPDTGDTPLTAYQLEISLLDPANGASLPVGTPWDDATGTSFVTHSDCHTAPAGG